MAVTVVAFPVEIGVAVAAISDAKHADQVGHGDAVHP